MILFYLDYNQWLCTPTSTCEKSLPGKRSHDASPISTPPTSVKSFEIGAKNVQFQKWIAQGGAKNSNDCQSNKKLDRWILVQDGDDDKNEALDEVFGAKINVKYPNAETTLDNWLVNPSSTEEQVDNQFNDWLVISQFIHRI